MKWLDKLLCWFAL